MKILILGGTGAMGAHLVKVLAGNGHSVYVTSRSMHKPQSQISYILGNAQDYAFLKGILKRRWDVIVDFMLYSTSSFERRLDCLLDATEQYVYISSSRVYANSEELITEDSPRLLDVTTDSVYLSTEEYALSKARQENLLFNSRKSNWTIIRPYITYSEEKLQLGGLQIEAWLYRALHNRPIAFSVDINSKVTTLTYGLDVAKGISAIIGEKNALGEAFHITSQDSVIWKDVLSTYINVLGAHFGKKPEVILQSMEQFSAWNTGKYQIKYDRLFNRRFDNSKIEKYVDTSDFVDTATGLRMCLESFLESPKFIWLDWRKEAIKDRQLNVRAPLTELPGLKQKIKYFIFRNTPI
ncbi:NAD-dependent epimerase/dehydratase family protein [Colwellia sp. 12G3]|uniref:NAD-dependent epimerase/dehydratase family protein n=1 Tax=Colwellia sp. 12G3 TaxID=2058299 RepID=UPI000C33A20F|nr:NAD-dependent epimerase/dehydratase family protein [Colwellia sp. 12G3]PKI17447.1 epimerase [Colwellia sp. 12G3]